MGNGEGPGNKEKRPRRLEADHLPDQLTVIQRAI